MAGEITKRLIGRILGDLKDEDMKIIENYGIACNKLNRYQLRFMQKELTSRRKYEIELTGETYSYYLDPHILRIVKSNFANTDIQLTTTPGVYEIILPDDAEFETEDILTIEAYIKPLQKDISLENGEDYVNDLISLTKDPIIEEEYYDLLIEAVLSEYRHINKNFRSLEEVVKEVKQIAAKMYNRNMLGTSGFSNVVRRQMRF